MLNGITFDYDGTIGQTFERQFNWFKHWAKTNEKKFPFNKNVRKFRDFYNKHCTLESGVQNVYDALSLPCNMNDRGHPVWSAYEKFKAENPVSFYPGIKDAIIKIWEMGHLSLSPDKNQRLRISINTTNTWGSIYHDLKRGNILHCFDCFVTDEVLRAYHGAGNPTAIHKPSRISLALTLGLINSSGDSVLHVGDSLSDLAASQKVFTLNPNRPETLITVGVAWGYEGREKLERGVKINDGTTAHFNYIIDKPKELVGIVERLG
ncbi:MAG: HAD hydrolase-like protein [Nanoarchaeota archaeon]|nr:HAD hydrolase-like protein [Nanoarchaeota archaeon]